ncbi:unnamed protein product [Bursaphelenchus xylophilus]|uniref:(pine wood nematode) hypothetical protein n=1 Tax=Bursaphelenchus xylophilus TaxID=6326 RepID=A0A1I7RJ97_BURXY|nr:unnamed protein product [Bursaphelenchus xylophilus]CAG9119492.1 unnamed protein product [Bursaphelenchus xylophilus]
MVINEYGLTMRVQGLKEFGALRFGLWAMEVFFFEPQTYERLYNCSFYDYTTIPLAQRQHVGCGLFIIVFYAACFALYLPCLAAMLGSELRKRSSYQLMIFLGFNHAVGLQCSGLITGIYGVIGAEYCMYPVAMYFIGILGLCGWFGSTMTTLVLGINRCCELHSAYAAQKLFGGCKTFVWLLAIMIYSYLFPTLFNMPPLYDGVKMSWFYNPHSSYFPDDKHVYKNMYHVTHNCIIFFAYIAVYVTFFALYLRRVKMASGKLDDKSTYIQVISIGFIHFATSVLYLVQQFVSVDFAVSMAASAAYLMSQGIPPFIYLKFNRTIRNTLKRLVAERASLVSHSSTTKLHSGSMMTDHLH